jgi:pimeloyl-ACP methyl ester carboxylesterase
MPAIIDYILGLTNQQSMIYIGHSMGTTISYVLLSTKPEYNDKINLVISLSPVAFWRKPHPAFIQILNKHFETIKVT